MVAAPHTFRNGNLEFFKGGLEFRMEFALKVDSQSMRVE